MILTLIIALIVFDSIDSIELFTIDAAIFMILLSSATFSCFHLMRLIIAFYSLDFE